MNPLKIQYELKKSGVTQKALAEELGCTEQHLGQVILKNRVSDTVMRAVAKKLGRDYRTVFPEYYLQPPKRKTSKVAAL